MAKGQSNPADDPAIAKGLPVNVDAERICLGAIMVDPEALSKVTLQPDDFSLEKHRRIFRRMIELREDGTPIDRITVANCLMAYSELESVDGLSYLVSLDDGMPQNPHVESYAAIVREKSIKRKVIFASQKMMDEALLDEGTAEDLLARAAQANGELTALLGVDSGLKTAIEIMEVHGGPAGFLQTSIKPGLPFGFEQLDEHLLGLHQSYQYVIAGYTGHGKSSLGQAIGYNLAKKGHGVLDLSLEMTKEQVIVRQLCAEAEVPLKAYLRKDMNQEQRAKIMHAVSDIGDLPFYVDDNPALSISQLPVVISRAVREKKIKAVILDYLGILDWQSDRTLKIKTEYDAMTLASRVMRMLARQYDIVSIVLSQLSRPPDKKKIVRPKLSDIRSSGAIEQDAYAVLFPWLEGKFFPEREDLKEAAEVIIAKARMGSMGVCNMRFKGKYAKFFDDGPLDSPAIEEED